MNLLFTASSLLKRIRFLRYDPIRDWYVLLAFGGFALIVLSVWNIFLFETVATGGVIGNSATTTEQTVDQSAFDAVHTMFVMRQIEEMKYKDGTYSYTDPSQ